MVEMIPAEEPPKTQISVSMVSAPARRARKHALSRKTPFMDFAIELCARRNCNRRMRERILITGPCGRVGKLTLDLLREHFALRLFDTQALPSVGDDEVTAGDIRDFEALRRACLGVKAVLHLAAISDEADFHSKLLPVNLAGTYNVFEAARLAGVKK